MRCIGWTRAHIFLDKYSFGWATINWFGRATSWFGRATIKGCDGSVRQRSMVRLSNDRSDLESFELEKKIFARLVYTYGYARYDTRDTRGIGGARINWDRALRVTKTRTIK